MTAEILDSAENEPGKLLSRKPKLDSYWNFGSVIFQVENTLFSVLKHAFLVPGTPFEAMFSLPPVDPKNIEGSSDDNPIILEDTLAEDFRAFLRIIYPIGVPEVKTCDEWMGVLRLSHKWSFIEVRQKAVSVLRSNHISQLKAHEKIRLGCKFLEKEWISQGLVDIAAKRDLEFEFLTAKPFCFDQEIIARLFYVQSKALDCRFPYRSYVGYRCDDCYASFNTSKVTHYCEGAYRANLIKLVDRCFAKEIQNGTFNIQAE